MKICGCLALFFYFGTQLWNCAKFSYAHDIKREGEGMYRYVRNIDGLRPCRLSCAPIHVWQGISYAWNHFMCNLVQIYNVISFTFTVFFSSSCCCFLLFYLFAHFFFPCMPRVSETNSQHNFICRDFAYIWFWMFASSRGSSENIPPRGALQNICAGQRDGCQLPSSCCCCCCSCRCMLLMKLCALIPHVMATQPRDRE